MSIKSYVGLPIKAKVVDVNVPRIGYRWYGTVDIVVEGSSERITLLMSGSIAQWLNKGELVKVVLKQEPIPLGKTLLAVHDSFTLDRYWAGEWVNVWPPWSKDVRLPRRDPIRGDIVYEYKVIAREAVSEQDYMDIVGLEQYHYASREEIVAVWRCPVCGKYFESNIQPKCPEHKVPARLQEIRGSPPSS